ncbi:19700_t:CDS:2 [Funneliformis geosporum]|nr:19700_t:CDS:2 [Funneliformis geosporum]
MADNSKTCCHYQFETEEYPSEHEGRVLENIRCTCYEETRKYNKGEKGELKEYYYQDNQSKKRFRPQQNTGKYMVKVRGVGKSTLAQALAVETTRQKIKTLLADCDPQQSTNAPARTSKGTYEIAQQANLLIQPTSATRADLEPAVREFNSLTKQGIPLKKLVLILNNLITLAEEKATRTYLKLTNYHCLPYALYARASYRQAQNEGKSISEISYQSLSKQVKKLLDSILEIL